MGKPELSLYHHPTTTVYIDDNRDFLNTLTMKSEPGSFKVFDDPHEGLAYIESQFRLSENFSKGKPLSPDINTPHKLVLPQNQICQKLNTLNRFAEPSVVVVDFSMPNLNGLDLSAQLTSPNCKKILLTGVANEKQAIHALNSDLIDFYIGKNEEELANRLEAIVDTLNVRYFMDLMPLSNHDAVTQIPFIYDSVFADYFEQVSEDLGAVEYYYVTNPGGFILIDKLGRLSRLIVLTHNDYQVMLEDISKLGAPDDCLNVMRKETHIPLLQNDEGVFEPNHIKQWREHSYPIRRVSGNEEYLCALVKNQSQCLTCYQDYLGMPSNRLH